MVVTGYCAFTSTNVKEWAPVVVPAGTVNVVEKSPAALVVATVRANTPESPRVLRRLGFWSQAALA